MSVASQVASAFAVRKTVAIRDCVHFCGYRYGRGEIHPYEQYAIGLAQGVPLDDVRSRFVAFLQRYRPLDLGHALGIELSRDYPLWSLPWRTPRQLRQYAGWHHAPGEVVDVMTYFSEAGIPRAVVEKEYAWHENAFAAMRDHGYRPAQHSYILARRLQGAERSAYLVTDGNHRLSALSALGQATVEIKLPLGTTVQRDAVGSWPMVRAGHMSREDALRVFDAYLHGNVAPFQADAPADIV